MRRGMISMRRGGKGGRYAPPQLSVPFMSGPDKPDDTFFALKLILGGIALVCIYTFCFIIGRAIALILKGN